MKGEVMNVQLRELNKKKKITRHQPLETYIQGNDQEGRGYIWESKRPRGSKTKDDQDGREIKSELRRFVSIMKIDKDQEGLDWNRRVETTKRVED